MALIHLLSILYESSTYDTAHATHLSFAVVLSHHIILLLNLPAQRYRQTSYDCLSLRHYSWSLLVWIKFFIFIFWKKWKEKTEGKKKNSCGYRFYWSPFVPSCSVKKRILRKLMSISWVTINLQEIAISLSISCSLFSSLSFFFFEASICICILSCHSTKSKM